MKRPKIATLALSLALLSGSTFAADPAVTPKAVAPVAPPKPAGEAAPAPKKASSLTPEMAQAILAAVDKDGDKKIELPEAKKAAEAIFAEHNKDKDTTLEAAEGTKLMTKRGFEASDTDKDGTVDLKEYLASVEKRFGRADKDRDGSVDAKELEEKPGNSLGRLIH